MDARLVGVRAAQGGDVGGGHGRFAGGGSAGRVGRGGAVPVLVQQSGAWPIRAVSPAPLRLFAVGSGPSRMC